MNFLLSLQLFGWLSVGLGTMQLIPVLLFSESYPAFLLSTACCFLFGVPLIVGARTQDRRIRPRDGFVIVGLGWILATILGALPFVFAGRLSFVDAVFESASGFTTTGSTVISGLDQMDKALLLWRAMTNGIGGGGIIVFVVAVLPLLGIGGMQLLKAEMSGASVDKLSPRIAETARRLWIVYVGLNVAAFGTYYALGMSVFDAFCHALPSIATGGLATHDTSVAYFHSPAIEWAVTFFMFLGATNFVLIYRVVTGRGRHVYRDAELILYCAIVLFSSLIIAFALENFHTLKWDNLRLAAFQVVSIITTTGFVTADYELWPGLAHLILLQIMAIGGMAGSTAGGMKVFRVFLGLRLIQDTILRFTHPHAVRNIKYAGQTVSAEVIEDIGVFIAAYIMLIAVASCIVSTAGYDIETSLSAAISALANVGPGFGAVGPTQTYAHFPDYIKLTLTFCMIAGRLELFTILALMQPAFWRR